MTTIQEVMMTDADRVPTTTQVLAARVIVAGSRRLGEEVEPEIIRDAEWPLEKARRPERRG
jgi:hypothetical protein